MIRDKVRLLECVYIKKKNFLNMYHVLILFFFFKQAVLPEPQNIYP